ncbi:hypothetical protein WAI453_009635 [Rhynchosporium graminicola]
MYVGSRTHHTTYRHVPSEEGAAAHEDIVMIANFVSKVKNPERKNRGVQNRVKPSNLKSPLQSAHTLEKDLVKEASDTGGIVPVPPLRSWRQGKASFYRNDHP